MRLLEMRALHARATDTHLQLSRMRSAGTIDITHCATEPDEDDGTVHARCVVCLHSFNRIFVCDSTSKSYATQRQWERAILIDYTASWQLVSVETSLIGVDVKRPAAPQQLHQLGHRFRSSKNYPVKRFP
jgi:hypothetical protein